MFCTSNFCSGELAHALRFLASVVSQSFMAFGDILELHRKYLELSGGINRIFELEELLDVAQKGASLVSSFCKFLCANDTGYNLFLGHRNV